MATIKQKDTFINNGFAGMGTMNPSTLLHITPNTPKTPNTPNTVNITKNSPNYFNTITNQSCITLNTATFSDQRIKQNIIDLTDVQETTLQKFRKIQPKIFQYIDNIQYGNQQQYGFIAQQIEKVLPSIIEYHTLYIPNIYEIADVSYNIGTSSNTITLHEKSTNQFEYDISKNLFTKLKCYDESNNEYIINIKSIINEKTFEIGEIRNKQNIQLKSRKVFVYGQEVNNYMSIDYDTLFMLSFFATQQLDKEMQTTKQEVNAMKEELTSLLIKITDVANNCCNIDQDFQ